jgi:hypothetical protein
MDWVKKNLIFVASLAVAVALLGYGVFFFLGKKGAAETVDGELQTSTQSLEQLYQRDPFPSEENIRSAKEQQEQLARFRTNATLRFPRAEGPEAVDSATFKAMLENTIAGLEREAERSGVKLPQKFNFTFKDQREKFQLAAGVLPTLTAQLQDVDHMCRTVFGAKVNELIGLKRSPVETNEVSGFGGVTSEDFLTKKISTNQTVNAAIYPYEIAFNCFSPELASVLAGLANSSGAFLVKTINIERPDASGTDAMTGNPMATMPYPYPGGRMDPMLAQRYGLASRYGRPPPSAVAPTPVPQTATRPNAPVLDEKPLKVTLGIEVVRMLPVRAPAPVGRTPAPVARATPAEQP